MNPDWLNMIEGVVEADAKLNAKSQAIYEEEYNKIREYSGNNNGSVSNDNLVHAMYELIKKVDNLEARIKSMESNMNGGNATISSPNNPDVIASNVAKSCGIGVGSMFKCIYGTEINKNHK